MLLDDIRRLLQLSGNTRRLLTVSADVRRLFKVCQQMSGGLLTRAVLVCRPRGCYSNQSGLAVPRPLNSCQCCQVTTGKLFMLSDVWEKVVSWVQRGCNYWLSEKLFMCLLMSRSANVSWCQKRCYCCQMMWEQLLMLLGDVRRAVSVKAVRWWLLELSCNAKSVWNHQVIFEAPLKLLDDIRRLLQLSGRLLTVSADVIRLFKVCQQMSGGLLTRAVLVWV